MNDLRPYLWNIKVACIHYSLSSYILKPNSFPVRYFATLKRALIMVPLELIVQHNLGAIQRRKEFRLMHINKQQQITLDTIGDLKTNSKIWISCRKCKIKMAKHCWKCWNLKAQMHCTLLHWQTQKLKCESHRIGKWTASPKEAVIWNALLEELKITQTWFFFS